MNFIFDRATVRDFSDVPLEIIQVEKLIKAGMQAPSARNAQPWEFLIVIDSEDKLAVSKMGPTAKCAKDAQKLIITMANMEILEDTGTTDWLCQDLAACNENILLQATVEGIGSAWIGFYPNETRVDMLRKYFEIPDHVLPFSVIALGFPKDTPVARVNFDIDKIHIGRY